MLCAPEGSPSLLQQKLFRVASASVIFPNVLHHSFGCAGQVVAVLVMTQMMALAGHDLGPAGLISYAHPEEVSMAQGLGRQG